MSNFHSMIFPKDRIEEAYVEYCLENCQQIIREYRLKGGNTEEDFPHFCLTTFLRSGESLTRYKFAPIEKAYIRACVAYLETHGRELWNEYKQNEEYKKEIAKSYLYVRAFKHDKRKYPPRNYKELDLMFGAGECFMLIGDKKLL